MQDLADQTCRTWHSELDMEDRRSMIESVRRVRERVLETTATHLTGHHPPRQILLSFQTKRPQVCRDWGARWSKCSTFSA